MVERLRNYQPEKLSYDCWNDMVHCLARKPLVGKFISPKWKKALAMNFTVLL